MDVFEKWDKENGLIPDDMLYRDGKGNTFTQSEIDEMVQKNGEFVASDMNTSALARWRVLRTLATSIKDNPLVEKIETTEPNPRKPFATVYVRGFSTGNPQPLGKAIFLMCQLADICGWAESPEGTTLNFDIKIFS